MVFSEYSVLEVLNELLVIQVCPVIHLDLLVEWLQLLLYLVLRSSIDELFLCGGDVRGIQDQQDLGLNSAVVCGVFEFEDAVSKINSFC